MGTCAHFPVLLTYYDGLNPDSDTVATFLSTCLELIQVFWSYQQPLYIFSPFTSLAHFDAYLLRNQWPVFLVTRAWKCYIYVTGFTLLVFFCIRLTSFKNVVLKINRPRHGPVGFGFKSLARYQLTWLIFFKFLFSPSSKMSVAN